METKAFPQTLSVEEAAAYLAVGADEMDWWLARGELRLDQDGRIVGSELAEFVKRRTVPARPGSD